MRRDSLAANVWNSAVRTPARVIKNESGEQPIPRNSVRIWRRNVPTESKPVGNVGRIVVQLGLMISLLVLVPCPPQPPERHSTQQFPSLAHSFGTLVRRVRCIVARVMKAAVMLESGGVCKRT